MGIYVGSNLLSYYSVIFCLDGRQLNVPRLNLSVLRSLFFGERKREEGIIFKGELKLHS